MLQGISAKVLDWRRPGNRHSFLTDDKYKDGNVRLALYELKDSELVDLLVANGNRIEVILPNTSKEHSKRGAINQKSRKAPHAAGLKSYDCMFNNNHIGHNKFAHDWQHELDPTGLYGQSNNALLITADDIAEAYNKYCGRLLEDRFPAPRPSTAQGTATQRQGEEFREADRTPLRTRLEGVPGVQL